MSSKSSLERTHQSRGDFTNQLRDSGQYEAFNARRSILVANGMSPKEAWDTAAVEYGWVVKLGAKIQVHPKDGWSKESHGPARKAAKQRVRNQASISLWDNKPKSPKSEDVFWVYDHLFLDDVKAEDCPASGAWGLYQWAKANTDKFYALALPMVQARGAEMKRQQSDEKSQLKLIDQCILSFRSQGEERESSLEATSGEEDGKGSAVAS